MINANFGSFYKPTRFLQKKNMILFVPENITENNFRLYLPSYVYATSINSFKSRMKPFEKTKDKLTEIYKRHFLPINKLRDSGNLWLAPMQKTEYFQLYYIDEDASICIPYHDYYFSRNNNSYYADKFYSLIEHIAGYSFEQKTRIAPDFMKPYIYYNWMSFISSAQNIDLIEEVSMFISSFCTYLYQDSLCQTVFFKTGDEEVALIKSIIFFINEIASDEIREGMSETLKKIPLVQDPSGLIKLFGWIYFDEENELRDFLNNKEEYLKNFNRYTWYFTPKARNSDIAGMHKYSKRIGLNVRAENILWIQSNKGTLYTLINKEPVFVKYDQSLGGTL